MTSWFDLSVNLLQLNFGAWHLWSQIPRPYSIFLCGELLWCWNLFCPFFWSFPLVRMTKELTNISNLSNLDEFWSRKLEVWVPFQAWIFLFKAWTFGGVEPKILCCFVTKFTMFWISSLNRLCFGSWTWAPTKYTYLPNSHSFLIMFTTSMLQLLLFFVLRWLFQSSDSYVVCFFLKDINLMFDHWTFSQCRCECARSRSSDTMWSTDHIVGRLSWICLSCHLISSSQRVYVGEIAYCVRVLANKERSKIQEHTSKHLVCISINQSVVHHLNHFYWLQKLGKQ